MSFPANFYTISKRDNSTKQPTGSGTTKNICLKDECGIVNPSIILTGESNPTSFNMVYIDAFSRYYHINNWTYDRGEWIADCTVDVLASYKASIEGSTKYVERSSLASACNPSIIDSYYPATSTCNYTGVMGTEMFDVPCVIVAISNNQNTSARGALSYYAMGSAAIQEFFGWLLGTPHETSTGHDQDSFLDWVFNLLGLVDNAIKATLNPMQYIIGAKFLPFTPSGTTTNTIYFGTWSIPMTNAVTLVSPYAMEGSAVHTGWAQTIAIPKHPKATEQTKFLNASPYSRYRLNVQPFGEIAIDGILLKDMTDVSLNMMADVITGDAVLDVYGANSNTGQTIWIGEYQANLASEVPLAQLTQNFITPVIQMASGVAGLLSGSPTGMAGMASGIVSAFQSMLPITTNKGGEGSAMIAYRHYPFLEGYFQDITDLNVADAGYPVMKRLLISSLATSGGATYIKCSDGDIVLSCTQQEREEVSRYLTSGFYYE